ncbi:DNA-binding response OmpR family regulator [Sedimentibacter acidaminivorans]|jgi:two-component system, OmpR family, response regulator ResD|uniref:DNA-binding response OmpR family regulator n=1 Tax=Sedimentibacter acidaminivorans TaxID=913099 RepID=A0ABS4GF88_9FIRM|nr:response regulator transcription factor [Sedimentibacter acidaminivorans]MBP1926339.1 DNA-binding response OmpR family regulator [Sedimentibacter acidaminivorans]
MESKILLAEDEDNIRKLISSYLVNEGFKVIAVADGEEAISTFDNNYDFSLIILDVMMPKIDGYEVSRYIRKNSEVPILMLTARDTETDEITGFNSGADEYIAKPFSPRILVTRVKNLLKRTSMNSMQDIELEGISIKYRERLVLIDGEKAILTPKEFDLFYYLLQNKNIVLSRSQILSTVWDWDYFGDDRTVDTHIKCLRSKIGKYGKSIVTIRKIGYKFEIT